MATGIRYPEGKVTRIFVRVAGQAPKQVTKVTSRNHLSQLVYGDEGYQPGIVKWRLDCHCPSFEARAADGAIVVYLEHALVEWENRRGQEITVRVEPA